MFLSGSPANPRVRRLHDDHGVPGFITTRLTLLSGIFLLAGCSHPGPVLDFGTRPPLVGGTISGIVTTTGSSIPAQNRQVTVTNVRTATKYEAQTAVDVAMLLRQSNRWSFRA